MCWLNKNARSISKIRVYPVGHCVAASSPGEHNVYWKASAFARRGSGGDGVLSILQQWNEFERLDQAQEGVKLDIESGFI